MKLQATTASVQARNVVCSSSRSWRRGAQGGRPSARQVALGRCRAAAKDVESTEKVLSISDILSQAKEASTEGGTFVFSEPDPDLPPAPWEEEYDERLESNAGRAEAYPEPEPEAKPPTAYDEERGFKEVSVQQAAQGLTNGGFDLLLDVRNPDEYSQIHARGARLLPLPQLGESVRAGALDEYKAKSIAIICRSGARSAQACVKLEKVFGFQSCTNVAGGTIAWMDAGLPAGKQGEGGCGSGCGCH